MKRKALYVLIVTLLLSAIMVSCNSEVADSASQGNKLVNVTVMAGVPKSITVSTGSGTDVASLYWFYTANKTDGSIFIDGQTGDVKTPVKKNGTTPTVGLVNSDLGLFSTGSWTFSFWGYKADDVDTTKTSGWIKENAKPVYYQENLAATVVARTDLTLTLVEGEGMADATLFFNNPTWTYVLAPSTKLTLRVFDGDPLNGGEELDLNGSSTEGNGVSATTNNLGVATFNGIVNQTRPAGAHTLYFVVYYNNGNVDVEVGRTILGLNLKKGTTYTLSGSIENLNETYHVWVKYVNQTTVIATKDAITTAQAVDIVAPVTPLAAESSTAVTEPEKKTTVKFESGALDHTTQSTSPEDTDGKTTTTKTESTHDLEVEVKTAATASSAQYVVSYENTPVAGVNLTLTKNTTVTETVNIGETQFSKTTTSSSSVLTEFNNTYVTIRTYIGKGLSDVKVYYNGTTAEQPKFSEKEFATEAELDAWEETPDTKKNGTGYVPTTGLLVFKTKHFSEFFVTSKSVASIGDVVYGSLQAAIDAVKAGETIKLLVDLTLTETLPVERGFDFTLDLNNHSISAKNTRAMRVNEGKLTLAGTGTISSNTEGVSSFSADSSVIRVGSGFSTDDEGGDYAGLVVGKDITISSNHCYGIAVFGKDTYGQTLDIYGKVLVTGSASAVSGNGTNTLTSTTITIYNGAEVKSTNEYAIYHPQSGTLTVKDGAVVEGKGGIEAKGGQVIIEGGSVKATATEQTHSAYNNGASTSGYALASVMNSVYKGAGSIIVKNGKITGKILLVSDNTTRPETKLIAAGGIYTVDPRKSGDDKNYVPGGYDVTENPETSTTPKTWTVLKHNHCASCVAMIACGDYNGSDIYFDNLQDAINAAKAGETIVLLENITQDDGYLFNKEGMTITLNTNGKTITVNSGSNINSRAFRIDNGTLIVNGSGQIVSVGSGTTSSDGKGCYGAFRVEANGKLIASDLTLTNARPWGLNVKVLGGEAELTNVTINSSYGGGIEVTEADLGTYSKTGSATLTNCTFSQTGYYDHCSTPLSVSGGSELIVNGGTYTSANHVLYVFSSGGVITVNNGTFYKTAENDHAGIVAAIDTNTYPQYIGGLIINDGNFTCNYAITYPAYMSITGGTFDHDPTAYVDDGYGVIYDKVKNTFEVVESWTKGLDPYIEATDLEISTAEELAKYALSSKTLDYTGHTVKLTADIDLKGKAWTPIYVKYGATFDGQDHVISNMNVVGKKEVGLFGTTTGLNVSNVVLDNAVVVGINQVGGIVGHGQCARIKDCKVKNSYIKAYVYDNDDGDKVGAITGYLTADVNANTLADSCPNILNCTVENCVIIGYRDVGSFAGMAQLLLVTAEVEMTGSVSNVTLVNDRTVNYKIYTTEAQYDVNDVIGENTGIHKYGISSVNTSSVTKDVLKPNT